MYTLDILSKTLSFTLSSSSLVTLRLGVDVFYTGTGTSFDIPLPLKNSQVQEGAYVLNVGGVETILSYTFPTEVPDIVWDVNGLHSTLSVGDNKTYTGTIISQSIDCTPPVPLSPKTGLNNVSYTPNIYSGDWSIVRKIKLSYDAGNGLSIINTIENTYTKVVLNINGINLYQSATKYINEFVSNCSPQNEIVKFTKINAYLQQYDNYAELADLTNAYYNLVKAGELIGTDKDIQEIIPFSLVNLSANQWVNSNGSKVESHIVDESLHLKQGDRTKLDNLSGINTGDQDLSGLEPKRGIDDFYVTNAEKTLGSLATGNATLTTVNQVANYVSGLTFKLIGSFTPIVGTSAFSTVYDGNGVLLSSLNIKRCVIEIYATSTATTIQVGLLRINNVATSTYKQTTNIQTGILFRNNSETYSTVSLDFSGVLKYYAPSVNSNTMANDAAFSGITYQGINRTIINSKLEQIDLILGGGATFMANSIINIYVL